MSNSSDLERMRQEYIKRKNAPGSGERYSLSNPAQHFLISQRQRSLVKSIIENHLEPFDINRVLEIGCGTGGVLQELTTFGYPAENLYGIDILFDRLQDATLRLPNASVHCADGQNLPFAPRSFDLVLQFTAFSSVLDDTVKHNMAADMLRVLKDSGSIIWYDFWLNPTNKQTRGIQPKEIRELFPDCTFQFHKITLAPPIARRIVPISWSFAVFLESLKFLNSHYLVIIQKK